MPVAIHRSSHSAANVLHVTRNTGREEAFNRLRVLELIQNARKGEKQTMNLCRSCNEDFGSLLAFDTHRIGKHAYTYEEGLKMNPTRTNGRRCLSVEEMLESGFVKNKRNTWSLERDLARGRSMKEIALES